MEITEVHVNRKKIILFSAALIIIQFFVFYILWMNPVVKEISAQVATHPSIKPYEFIGGIDNWMKIRSLFHILFLAAFVYLFILFYKNIPGSSWVKGLNFGLIIGLIKHGPEAFNQWTLIVYPNQLILLQLLNGVISLVVFGILVSFVFEKFRVIVIERKS